MKLNPENPMALDGLASAAIKAGWSRMEQLIRDNDGKGDFQARCDPIAPGQIRRGPIMTDA